MFDRNQQKIFTGCCLALYTMFALICLAMHFSFAGLLIFIGAAAMTVGVFAAALQMLMPCGFALSALAFLVEFIGYLIQSFSRGFISFHLLFPVLEGILMIAVFAGLLKISIHTDKARMWGLCVTLTEFAAMLLVVGTAFAGQFTGPGEVNYFVFLERLVLIPVGFFFGGFMEGEEPLLTIDLEKDDGTEGSGQVIGYTPEEVPHRHRRSEAETEGTGMPEETGVPEEADASEKAAEEPGENRPEAEN